MRTVSSLCLSWTSAMQLLCLYLEKSLVSTALKTNTTTTSFEILIFGVRPVLIQHCIGTMQERRDPYQTDEIWVRCSGQPHLAMIERIHISRYWLLPVSVEQKFVRKVTFV